MKEPEQLKQQLADVQAEIGFRLESRQAKDVLNNLRTYASAIPFSGEEDTFWNTFWFANQQNPDELDRIYHDFTRADQRLPVQQAFFLTLLQLMETPTTLLNTLPGRHRTLYYKDLLGFELRHSQPDTVVVSFTLSGDTAEYLLPAGTLLDAGQDRAGNSLTYALDSNFLATQQQLSKLCWTRKDNDKWKLCTALDEQQNISLPADGVRLFGVTDHEEELTQKLFFSSALFDATLGGELQIAVTLTSDSNQRNAANFPVISCHSPRGILQQRKITPPDRLIFTTVGHTQKVPTGSQPTASQLSLQFPATEPLSVPESVAVTLIDSSEISYLAAGQHGSINTFSYPFGLAPRHGQGFELSLPAAFSASGGTLTLEPQWYDLPSESFTNWYVGYPQPPADNSAFNVQCYLLTPDGWQPQGDPQPLFSGPDAPQACPLVLTIPAENLPQSPGIEKIRVELTGGDFFHALWQQNPAGKNPPYTPQISEMNTRFCQQLPLGMASAERLSSAKDSRATTSQALYLGCVNSAPGETLSLYWSLNAPTPLMPDWYYYNQKKEWVALAASIDDHTQGLYGSGLWQVILPDDIAPGGDTLSTDYYWLKAVPGKAEIAPQDAPRLKAVNANAMTATLSTSEVDPQHFSQALPAGTISQLVSPVAEISQVNQPQPSVGGKAQETETLFVQRVAKRLAHRNRAITWGNIITLLTEQYLQILDIRTPHLKQLTQIPALETQDLTVIPNNRYRDNDDALRPTLSSARLAEMNQWLGQHTSMWASPVLSNPDYIDVIASYEAKFNPGVNPAYGYRQLATLLQQQYMPWGDDLLQGVTLGNQIDYYGLLATIQQSPLVRQVVYLTLARTDQESDPSSENIIAQQNEVLILIPQPKN